MARLYVRHPVNDYATWRAAYDGTAGYRAENGVTADGVHQAVDDANDVTVWHDFASREAAERFASSEWLKDVMQEAGVAGPPTVWIVNDAS